MKFRFTTYQEGISTPTMVVRKSGFQMPESQCIKPTVKVTVVTDEKKNLHREACDTQDSRKKSVAHQSTSKSSADNKRSVKLQKARKMSKEDFPNAPKRAMNAYMYFAESNRKGNNLTATHLSFIIYHFL